MEKIHGHETECFSMFAAIKHKFHIVIAILVNCNNFTDISSMIAGYPCLYTLPDTWLTSYHHRDILIDVFKGLCKESRKNLDKYSLRMYVLCDTHGVFLCASSRNNAE